MLKEVEGTRPALQRQIGPIALLFTGITGIMGSGWLFASLYAAQIAGPAAILSWMIGGGVALLLALVYAELGGMLPLAGAIARIPYFSHGSMSGFMAGWLCWIAYVATAPIEVTAVLQYSSNLLPWLTTTIDGNRVLTGHGVIVATVLLMTFVILNLAGVRWLARANLAVTAWKLAVPLLAVAGLIVFGFEKSNFTDHGGFMPTGADGIFAAVAGGGVIFSLFGFRTVIDMAGEAANPQRNVPFAMVGAVVITLVIYVLLQVAFIGAVPTAHLAGGWTQLAENVADGPFAAFATILGLQGLAALLYVDAIVSPTGTGIAYTGATARINYALAENGQLPKLFMRLNTAQVPVWSILINFLVGLLLLLPLPGWSQLIGFISSAAILSLAFGPVSLAAMRHQLPAHKRPFRLKGGIAVSAIAFMMVGCIVYWAGWQTNWKVFALAIAGGALLIAVHYWTHESEKLDLKQSLWFWLFIDGLGVLSFVGNYGGGLGLLPKYGDLAIVAAFSLLVFWIAIRDRLPDAETDALLKSAQLEP
ncbi:MAG: APC family permease [Hyphomicrobium sp.]|jgi:amino acid transporter